MAVNGAGGDRGAAGEAPAEERPAGRIPLRVKFAYGGAEGSLTLVWTMFYIYFMIFLTDVAGLSPATAGAIMMVATVWDAVTDPAVGIWSDTITSRWGRRRPFFLFTALPFGVAAWLLFSDFELGPAWTAAYFVTAVIFFFTAYTLINIPYTAMAAEMTQDYDERTSLVSFRLGWSQFFTIAAAALPLVLADCFEGVLGSEKLGWMAMAAVIGGMAVFPILLTWRYTRGYELFPECVSFGWREVKDAALKNRPFLYTLGAYASGAVALNVAAQMLPYFTKYNLGFSDDKTSIVLLVLFATTLLWVPAIAVAMSRLGKRRAYIVFAAAWAVPQGIAVLFIQPGRDPLLFILMVIAAAGVTAIPMVQWDMIPDVVEVDEYRTGQRREGMYTGITTFVQKLAVALALFVNGLVLTWAGYVADVEQTSSSLWGIRMLFGYGTVFFLAVSIVFTYLCPMTRERHDALRECIRLKKEGKGCDESGIKELLHGRHGAAPRDERREHQGRP